MIPRTSQYHPGSEVPEKNLYYRLAKKFLFNDFGVYNGHDHTKSAAPWVAGVQTETATAAPANGCCSTETVELGVPVTDDSVAG